MASRLKSDSDISKSGTNSGAVGSEQGEMSGNAKNDKDTFLKPKVFTFHLMYNPKIERTNKV